MSLKFPWKLIKTSEFDAIVHKLAQLQAQKIVEIEKEKIEDEIQSRVDKVINDANFIDDLREGIDVYLDLETRGYQVFSIERTNHGKSDERTIVGYFWEDQDGRRIKQWTLYISRKAHNQLVQEVKLKRCSIGN